MRLAPLLILLLSAATSALAQTPGTCAPGTASGELDVSDVRATVAVQSTLFMEPGVNTSEYVVPATGNVSAIFLAHLWVTAEVAGATRASAALDVNTEMWPGPLDTGATLPNPADCSAYDRVWVVSALDVQAYEMGGTPTADLAQWPVGLGAPAVDAGGNPIVTTDRARVLNLAAGERPVIYGSQTAFWVMNDVGNAHAYTTSAPLGLEVQVAAFAVASPEPALDQATFYRYRLVNRAAHTLADARAGLWVDSDLGNASDDYVAADTARGMLVFYNSDNNDETTAGYGSNPPAIGIDVLSGAGSALRLLKNSAGGPTPIKDPAGPGSAQPVEYARLLHGLWRDGTPITEGGLGYQTGGPVVTSTLPGAPETGAFWSMPCPETPACGTPAFSGDYRGVVSSAGFALAPGESHDVTFAIVYARGSDHLDSVARLRAASDRVQHAYDDGTLWQTTTDGEPGPEPYPGYALLAPAPNPAAGTATLAFTTGAAGHVRLAVYDALGREVAVPLDAERGGGADAATLDTRGLAPGAYVVVLEAAGVRLTQRLAVAR